MQANAHPEKIPILSSIRETGWALTLPLVGTRFVATATPAGFRQSDGFGVNTDRRINAQAKVVQIKHKWHSSQGLKNNTNEAAMIIGGQEPAPLTHDLFGAIQNGDYPSWGLRVHVLEADEFSELNFDPLDATTTWPETVIPVRPVGRLTLQKFPTNHFRSISPGGPWRTTIRTASTITPIAREISTTPPVPSAPTAWWLTRRPGPSPPRRANPSSPPRRAPPPDNHNLTVNFKKVKNRDVVTKMIGHFARANDDPERKLAEANGVDRAQARKLVMAPPAGSR